MAAGDFEKAVEPFDPTMQRALPAAKLKQVWGALIGRYGPLKEATVTRSEKIDQLQAVDVGCQFERDKLAAKVVFTADDRITGLFFQPAAEYKAPAYVDPARLPRARSTSAKHRWRCPGTLSLPKGDGPFPAVVLVHGSGPNDRDETIGPCKPFRDLAQGLASRGIAVLRYEKRTKAHPAALALLPGGITVKEETVDDAAAAVGLLASHEKIESAANFRLGPQLGRIAAAANRRRPRRHCRPDQLRWLDTPAGGFAARAGSLSLCARWNGQPRGAREARSPGARGGLGQVAQFEGRYARRRSASEGSGQLLAGPARLRARRSRQGDQAADADLARRARLPGDDGRFSPLAAGPRLAPDVTFITYPALNHLFMAGQGKSTSAEYWIPGNVAPEVVRDIARWINQHGSP